MKDKAIVVDLDNTLTQMGKRHPFDWSKVDIDFPIPFVVDIVKNYPHHVFILTARCEGTPKSPKCGRDATVRWLEKYVPNYSFLLMKSATDNRKATVVKYELINQILNAGYEIEYAIDDDKDVCDVYNRLKVPTLNVKCIF